MKPGMSPGEGKGSPIDLEQAALNVAEIIKSATNVALRVPGVGNVHRIAPMVYVSPGAAEISAPQPLVRTKPAQGKGGNRRHIYTQYAARTRAAR